MHYSWLKPNLIYIVIVADAAGERDGPRRLKSPWTSIAENVLEDVVSSFHNLKKEFNCENLDELNPQYVVRLGKILFHG